MPEALELAKELIARKSVTPEDGGCQDLIAQRLARAGLDVIMSSKLSWVNLIQYDNATETTGINSRLHWIPEAGRELFIVLNHSLEDFDRDGSNRSLGADFTIKYRHTFRY